MPSKPIKKKQAAKKKPAKRKRKPGRKKVLDKDLTARIVERIQACFYLKHAIESLGYSERVLHKWLQLGEEEITRLETVEQKRIKAGLAVYVHLVREVRKAQSENIRAHAMNIQRNALGQPAQYLRDEKNQIVTDGAGQPILLQPFIAPVWQASARYLEAVDHERWGRKIKTEVSVPEGGPSELRITVVEKRKVKEQLEEV